MSRGQAEFLDTTQTNQTNMNPIELRWTAFRSSLILPKIKSFDDIEFDGKRHERERVTPRQTPALRSGFHIQNKSNHYGGNRKP
jgi:hypothetical protein